MNKKFVVILFFIALLLPSPEKLNAQKFSDKKIVLKIVNYDLDISVDYEKEKLFSTCKMSVENFSDKPVNKIPFLLYRLLRVTSIKDKDGNSLEFEQDVVAYEDWEQYQVNFISLNLDKPMLPQEKMIIAIEYEGYLFGLTETGMRYVQDRIDKTFTIIRKDCRAYPEIGYPSWKVNRAAGLPYSSYDVHVTVPQDYIVANGGELTGKKEKNGLVTWSYKNILPAWRIDIAVADYGILDDKENKLKIFYFKKDEEGARRGAEAMKKAMALYTGWFGPLYDNVDFTVLEIPEGYGSQTDVTSIIQTADAFTDPDRLFTLYHEISHRWSVMETDPFPSRFEAEGSATFLQYLATVELEGKKDALEKGLEYTANRFRSQCKNNPGYKNVPIIDYGKEGITGLSYTKGMIFFYVLYEIVGKDSFNDIIGSFYREYDKTGATSEQFISIVREKSPVDITKFLQEWIYSTESSQYIIDKLPMEEIVAKYK